MGQNPLDDATRGPSSPVEPLRRAGDQPDGPADTSWRRERAGSREPTPPGAGRAEPVEVLGAPREGRGSWPDPGAATRLGAIARGVGLTVGPAPRWARASLPSRRRGRADVVSGLSGVATIGDAPPQVAGDEQAGLLPGPSGVRRLADSTPFTQMEQEMLPRGWPDAPVALAPFARHDPAGPTDADHDAAIAAPRRGIEEEDRP